MEEMKSSIQDEAKRLAVDALYSEKGHFAAARIWRRINLALGIPATLLAAAAGATIISGFAAWLPGLLAFSASALSAIITFLNPAKIAGQHHTAGVQYAVLRRRLRQFIQIDVIAADAKDSSALLTNLTDRLAKVQADSPAIPHFAWNSARHALTDGSAEYTAEELRLASGE